MTDSRECDGGVVVCISAGGDVCGNSESCVRDKGGSEVDKVSEDDGDICVM